jgi:hypothetical protein
MTGAKADSLMPPANALADSPSPLPSPTPLERERTSMRLSVHPTEFERAPVMSIAPLVFAAEGASPHPRPPLVHDADEASPKPAAFARNAARLSTEYKHSSLRSSCRSSRVSSTGGPQHALAAATPPRGARLPRLSVRFALPAGASGSELEVEDVVGRLYLEEDLLGFFSPLDAELGAAARALASHLAHACAAAGAAAAAARAAAVARVCGARVGTSPGAPAAASDPPPLPLPPPRASLVLVHSSASVEGTYVRARAADQLRAGALAHDGFLLLLALPLVFGSAAVAQLQLASRAPSAEVAARAHVCAYACYLGVDSAWLFVRPHLNRSASLVVTHHILCLWLCAAALLAPRGGASLCARAPSLTVVELAAVPMVLRRYYAESGALELGFVGAWVALRVVWFPLAALLALRGGALADESQLQACAFVCACLYAMQLWWSSSLRWPRAVLARLRRPQAADLRELI